MNEEWSMPDGPLDLYCSEADDQNNGEPTNLWMLLEDALSMQVTLRISVHRYLHSAYHTHLVCCSECNYCWLHLIFSFNNFELNFFLTLFSFLGQEKFFRYD